MREPRYGEQYADKKALGRWVEVKGIDITAGTVEVETVAASDDAQTERAVGRVTSVKLERFHEQFRLLDQCTFCGWNDTHRKGGAYHCPVTD